MTVLKSSQKAIFPGLRMSREMWPENHMGLILTVDVLGHFLHCSAHTHSRHSTAAL